jgi:hypothetical protein
MKRQHEESRKRNAKLKEDAASAARNYDALRSDSTFRLHKTQVHTHGIYEGADIVVTTNPS